VTETKTAGRKIFSLRNAIILVFILFLIVFGTAYYKENTKIVPEDLLTEAINNTLAAEAYRFKTKSVITINGEEKVFSDLSGEKADQNTFHVTGSMLGTDINVYQINETTYRLDPITQKWIVTENNSLLKESLLMAELNPLSNFYFTELISASYLGKEKVNKRKLYKLECVPRIKNKWLENYFKDLKYTVWVDKKDKMIKKATVSAKSKENESGSLTVDVELYDFGQKIKIEPPLH